MRFGWIIRWSSCLSRTSSSGSFDSMVQRRVRTPFDAMLSRVLVRRRSSLHKVEQATRDLRGFVMMMMMGLCLLAWLAPWHEVLFETIGKCKLLYMLVSAKITAAIPMRRRNSFSGSSRAGWRPSLYIYRNRVEYIHTSYWQTTNLPLASKLGPTRGDRTVVATAKRDTEEESRPLNKLQRSRNTYFHFSPKSMPYNLLIYSFKQWL